MTKQEFIDNMSEVMRQLSFVCKQNEDWKDWSCHDCPFYICCDILRHAGIVTPDNWEE